MAKDPTDYSTVDFISPVMNVRCGQVLVNRRRHIAIVAKKGRTFVHLAQVNSGVLKLTRYTASELVEEWFDADYPFDRALARLVEQGRRHGITDAARNALDKLIDAGRRPKQHKLFD
jgi:hypothetical protein